MPKLRRIIISVMVATCVHFAVALTETNAQRKPKFTSVYTDLKKECKAAFKESDPPQGDDVPLICKGYGGYKVTIGYSANSSQISIVRPTKAELFDNSIPLAMQGVGYSEEGKKVEWRMADGKPFAVILRISQYNQKGFERGQGDPYDAEFKIGESLIVRGLQGYDHIDFEIDVKSTPNANVRARELADGGYKK